MKVMKVRAHPLIMRVYNTRGGGVWRRRRSRSGGCGSFKLCLYMSQVICKRYDNMRTTQSLNIDKRKRLTYCDLNLGVNRKSDDVSQSGSKWEMLTDPSNPSPPHTQGLLPLLHAPAAYLVHGSTGVFHNTSLDLNYWQSKLLKLSSLYTFPFLHDFLHIFRHTSLPKNVPLSAYELKFSALFSDNPFSPLYLVHNRQTYANYFCQRNKHPCCLSEKMC
jgi:hypothetical protein